MELRHQLAAYSPITLAAALSGVAACTRMAPDPRHALAELLRSEFDARQVVLCGSGTQALQLAIEEAARGGAGDRPVALPAFGCFDLISAAIGARTKIALYDVDPVTLAPDQASLDKVLGDGVSACVLAPLFGMPLPWNELAALGERHGVSFIEDAAQGHGAEWRKRRLGAIGSLSVISFGRGKGWTGGRGGALFVRGASPDTGTQVPSSPSSDELTTMIGLVAQWAFGRPSIYGLARSIPGLELGMTRYHSPRSPVTMLRSAAATALATSRLSARETDARRRNAAALLGDLQSVAGVATIPTLDDAHAGFIRLPIRVVRGLGACELRGDARRLGIERSYPCNLAKLSPARPWLSNVNNAWPGADALADQLLTLPTHSMVTPAHRRALVQAVKALARQS